VSKEGLGGGKRGVPMSQVTHFNNVTARSCGETYSAKIGDHTPMERLKLSDHLLNDAVRDGSLREAGKAITNFVFARGAIRASYFEVENKKMLLTCIRIKSDDNIIVLAWIIGHIKADKLRLNIGPTSGEREFGIDETNAWSRRFS
jgi:hypothetical protein